MVARGWRVPAFGAAVIAISLLALWIAVSGPAGAKSPASSAAARASGPCPGTQIEPTQYARYRGKRVGALRVYYDSSTGKNCARMDHTKRTRGRTRMTFVYLRICRRNHRPGNVCRGGTRGVVDAGLFDYYAGPVITKRSARGRYLHARGEIVIKGSNRTVYMDPPVDHCGR